MIIRSGLFAMTLIFGTGAVAQPTDAQKATTESVTFTDLDLDSKEGQSALLRRIEGASDRVCDMGGMQSMDDFSQWGRCYRAALGDGRRQMDALIAARQSGVIFGASLLVVSGTQAN